MSPSYTYFTIPFDKVPATPPYTVWFARWSRIGPIVETGKPRPFVVGVTAGELPPGATLLGTGLKSSPYPEPPGPPSPTVSRSDYQGMVCEWLAAGGGDQRCTYFTIPFDELPELPPYVVWFAAWSPSCSEIKAGTCPPFVVGAMPLPTGATPLVSSMAKDPPQPPPAAPPPETSLSDYTAGLQDRGA